MPLGCHAFCTTVILLSRLARELQLNVSITVFEGGAFGGDATDKAAAPRSQLWFHRDGQLWAGSQPHVTLELQKSTRLLLKLARSAFHFPLALAIDREDQKSVDEVPMSEFYNALSVPYREIRRSIVERWFPMLNLPKDARIYRVRDGVVDIRLAMRLLTLHAKRLGVNLIEQTVDHLERTDQRISAIVLSSGERLELDGRSELILAAGARIRPMLREIGIDEVEGLAVLRTSLGSGGTISGRLREIYLFQNWTPV
jgi:glycine/D-amino acid oxidase-like deaminating enzyme